MLQEPPRLPKSGRFLFRQMTGVSQETFIEQRGIEYGEGNRDRQVVQRSEGLWLHRARNQGKVTFLCITRPSRETGSRQLNEGDRVEFSITQGNKGPAAPTSERSRGIRDSRSPSLTHPDRREATLRRTCSPGSPVVPSERDSLSASPRLSDYRPSSTFGKNIAWILLETRRVLEKSSLTCSHPCRILMG